MMLVMDSEKKVHIIHNYKLLEFLGDLGGFYEMIYVPFSLLGGYYSSIFL